MFVFFIRKKNIYLFIYFNAFDLGAQTLNTQPPIRGDYCVEGLKEQAPSTSRPTKP